MYMYVCIYIYIYLSLSLYIYLSIYGYQGERRQEAQNPQTWPSSSPTGVDFPLAAALARYQISRTNIIVVDVFVPANPHSLMPSSFVTQRPLR